MKALKRIALTELQVMFYSPIAWFVLIIFFFRVAMVFGEIFENFVRDQNLNHMLHEFSAITFTSSWEEFFTTLQEDYLYLYIPLLTMGIMSRELSSGSIKLLYSSPVTNFQIIFGKYLAVVVYALLMTFVMGIFVIYGAFAIDHFALTPCFMALLGLFLLICAYGTIGLFMSSLTSYQAIAAIGTFSILAVLDFVGDMWQDIAWVGDIMFWLALDGRVSEFIKGLLHGEDLIYFLTVIAMFLAFTIIRLKSIREKKNILKNTGMYLSVIIVVVLIGYGSSRATMMNFYDSAPCVKPNIKMGFAEGHGERNYKVFSEIDQDFDFRQVTLDKPVPEDIAILVIADMRRNMPEEHMKNLDEYIARGGNLFIAGEARRQAFMNPVLEKFGVQLLPGRLVCPTENWAQDLVAARPLATAAEFSFHFSGMVRYKQVATMPSAAGLDISGVKEAGFEPTVLMVADTAKRPQIWCEVETTNFVDDTAKLNPAVGEKLLQDSIPLMVALSRKVGNKEQKIMIFGDADCLSAAEISRKYRKLNSSNFPMVNASLFWLSDGEEAEDIRHSNAVNHTIFMTPTGILITKIIFMGLIPTLLLSFAILLWVHRKRR